MMYRLAGKEIDSPLLNAAGSINGSDVGAIKREVRRLAATGVGAITVGSFSMQPRRGNRERFGSRVYFFDEKSQATYNSLGLPNIGKEAALQISAELLVTAHDAGKLLIYSAAPTEDSESGNAVEQAVALSSDFLNAGVDLVEINVSCPNMVSGDRGRYPLLGYDLDSMAQLLASLSAEAGTTGRIGLKLPPYLTPVQQEMLPQLATMIRASRLFTYLVVCNTIPDQGSAGGADDDLLDVPPGARGLSGPAMRDVGRQQLALWRREVGDAIDIVSALGIGSGMELAYRLQHGAAAGSGVSFLWQSADWGNAVTKMLDEFAEAVNRSGA